MTSEPHSPPRADAADATTLDAIFRMNVRRHPDTAAMADPPDRETFTHGGPRALTCREADGAVTALAGRFGRLGLAPGSVVALQLPNTVESLVTLLATARAGLVAAPLPLLWRQAEIARALGRVDAKALIVAAKIGDTDYADLARHVAADTFTLRYVCAFGADLPDGVVPLDEIWEEAEAHSSEPPARAAWGVHDDALVTFDAGGAVAAVRTHAGLLAGGLATVAEGGLERDATILGTMLPSSFAALATAFVPWLLTGGRLLLHHPFDLATLSGQLADDGCDAAVLPGPLVADLAELGVLAPARAGVIAIWRAPERQAASPVWRKASALTDVLAFGEAGFVALRRAADGLPRAPVAGAVTAPSTNPDGAHVLTLARTAHGTLSLRGPIAPRRLVGEPSVDKATPALRTGEVNTGCACQVDPATRSVTFAGAAAGPSATAA